MARKLMADRFQLKVHEDSKEMPAYVLTVAGVVVKMTQNTGDANAGEGLFFGPIGTLHVRNAPMADFAQLLQASLLDRPVVDQTGLKGRWDFTLKWTPDEAQFAAMGARGTPPASDAVDAAPPLFTAMREQLGLKLEAEKTQVKVLVIDHVDHPSANQVSSGKIVRGWTAVWETGRLRNIPELGGVHKIRISRATRRGMMAA